MRGRHLLLGHLEAHVAAFSPLSCAAFHRVSDFFPLQDLARSMCMSFYFSTDKYSSSLSRSWRYRVVDVRLCVRGALENLLHVGSALSGHAVRELTLRVPSPSQSTVSSSPLSITFQQHQPSIFLSFSSIPTISVTTQHGFTPELFSPASVSSPLQPLPQCSSTPVRLSVPPLVQTPILQSPLPIPTQTLIPDPDETRSLIPELTSTPPSNPPRLLSSTPLAPCSHRPCTIFFLPLKTLADCFLFFKRFFSKPLQLQKDHLYCVYIPHMITLLSFLTGLVASTS